MTEDVTQEGLNENRQGSLPGDTFLPRRTGFNGVGFGKGHVSDKCA